MPYYLGRNKPDIMASYFLYIHTSPKGKRYVGITSYKHPQARWGKGGSKYSYNEHFWRAIQKYGWDNFKHEVILKDITYKKACEMEKYYIALYNTTDPNFGYNVQLGGTPGDQGKNSYSPEYMKEYRANHREASHEWYKRCYEKHKEAYDARRKKYRREHYEAGHEFTKRWLERFKEEHDGIPYHKWRKLHPNKETTT